MNDAKRNECEFGFVTNVNCDGQSNKTVVIEFVPEHLREKHRAARNRGRYPNNGAVQLRVHPECAKLLVDDEWTRFVT